MAAIVAVPVYHTSPDKMTLIFMPWQDSTKVIGPTTEARLPPEKRANIVCLQRGKSVPLQRLNRNLAIFRVPNDLAVPLYRF
jgi:hypothetical protein